MPPVACGQLTFKPVLKVNDSYNIKPTMYIAVKPILNHRSEFSFHKYPTRIHSALPIIKK